MVPMISLPLDTFPCTKETNHRVFWGWGGGNFAWFAKWCILRRDRASAREVSLFFEWYNAQSEFVIDRGHNGKTCYFILLRNISSWFSCRRRWFLRIFRKIACGFCTKIGSLITHKHCRTGVTFEICTKNNYALVI